MEASQLQDYLRHNIPISSAMGLTVETLSDCEISIAAPLSNNVNDKGTGFGGSIASLMTLAGWSLIHHKLDQANIQADTLIHKCHITYSKPVQAELHCSSTLSQELWQQALIKLEKKNKARIELDIRCHSKDQLCASMTGQYVILTHAIQTRGK